MTEAVRLVVWDLDETFWSGTFAEGGIKNYIQQNHDIVVALAERGIMSSVCSKNDKDQILPILEQIGILKYMIFPSISWEPKGIRIAQLIEAFQLRAPTVMFIDDNPNNLTEALAATPGLQVAGPEIIPHLLTDSRFVGKDDKALSRLHQYKLLENRKRDEEAVSGSNEEFLRSCNIRVYIEYDVKTHIDRAIELINRTNQLNYTKKRLPEKPEEARMALLETLDHFSYQAGLVRVVDNYGDYGFVGFFQTKVHRKHIVPEDANNHFVHFCFSCRTLGMFVEQWLYNYLRRPELDVVGEVLTDLSMTREIDWVTLVQSVEASTVSQTKCAPEFIVVGGCDVDAFGVYLRPYADNLRLFGNYNSGGLFVRLNSAVLINEMCGREPKEFAEEARALGIARNLGREDLFGNVQRGTVFVFNGTEDGALRRFYTHRVHGWKVLFNPLPFAIDLTAASEELLLEACGRFSDFSPDLREHVVRVGRHMREHYTLSPALTEFEAIDHMRKLADSIPTGTKLIIAIDAEEQRLGGRFKDHGVKKMPWIERYVTRARKIVEERSYVGMVSYSDVICDHSEIFEGGGTHYHRAVYLRFAQKVVEVASMLPVR